mgnify:CR=1 FL=1
MFQFTNVNAIGYLQNSKKYEIDSQRTGMAFYLSVRLGLTIASTSIISEPLINSKLRWEKLRMITIITKPCIAFTSKVSQYETWR